MAEKYIELFGEAAEKLDAEILISGRLSIQEGGIPYMVDDVLAKLKPRPTDRLLEIGCGTGLLLTPLAARVTEAVGLDCLKVLEKYKQKGVPHNVKLRAAEWPREKPDGTFDLIVVYSTLHYQERADEAYRFVQECIDILRPGGALLLGDLPNRDARRRFVESPGGNELDIAWKTRVEESRPAHAEFYNIFSRYGGLPRAYFNDAFIVELMVRARAQGLESYVLPQETRLPFSNTREDLLIRRRS